MQKLLRQKTSGHIYVWTEALASRDDMEPYEPQAKPAPEQNPNENSETAQPETVADLGIEDALEAFRKEVRKPGRKAKPQPGEA
jgi:hypothetical protein